ncbi:hypothetical protein Q8F55_008502 [Vanrija albida]|uniref:Histidine-specific methyltransferase SAM-dependent domain-containing protein n=1 Tax=Vanrija albida TaxID=181172 RepID=A0ABR3PR12_9TREE
MTNTVTIHTLPGSTDTDGAGESLRDIIEAGLVGGPRTVPGERDEDEAWAYTRTVSPLIHYDADGLKLFDQITVDNPSYYPFHDELGIFKAHGAEIAAAVGFSSASPDAVARGFDVVELGAGALRKTAYLLQAFADALPPSPNPTPLSYYALDLSKPELERVLGDLDAGYGAALARVSRVGLHADYDAGLKLAAEGKLAALSGGDAARPHHFAFIGTSLGNFSREDAGKFLASIPLRAGVDKLVLGLDGRPEPGEAGRRKVETAYNDPAGKGRAFEEHGWVVVRRELGLAPDTSIEWANRYNEPLGRHECYYRVKEEQTLHLPNRGVDVHLAKGELLHVEWSIKWAHDEAVELFTRAGLRVVQSWKAPTSEYRVWVLEKAE